MSKCVRLQGADWYAMKNQLIITGKHISHSGQIKLFLVDVFTGEKFTHWCNDEEKEMFI